MSIPVLPAIETRDVPAEFEIRETSDGFHFTGYAAVFDSPSEPLPFIETVRAGAFRRSINQTDHQIRMLVDHNPERLLATTKAATLRLSEDSRGLLADAHVAPTSYGNDLRILMERRDVSQMSFKFAPTKSGDRWTDDGMKRDLLDVKLFEVSVLTGNDPAYAATSASMRSLFEAMHEGRRLAPEEWSLMQRVIPAIAPRDSRWSSAASDAASATYALSTVLGLLGEEADDAAQSGFLKAAIAALQSFIASEADEIGTPEDVAESDEGDMQMNALPSPIHLMQTRRLRLLELAHFV